MRLLLLTVSLIALTSFESFAQDDFTRLAASIKSEANELMRSGVLMTRSDAKKYNDLAVKTADFIFNKLPKSGLSENLRADLALQVAGTLGDMIVASTDHYLDSVQLPDQQLWRRDKVQFFGEWAKYFFETAISNFRNLFVEGNPIWGRDARRTRVIQKMLKQLDDKSKTASKQSLAELPPERLVFLKTLYERLADIEPIQNRNINRVATISMWVGIGFLAFYPVEITFQLTDDSATLSTAIWLGLGALMHQARNLGRGDNLDEYVLSRSKFLNELGIENFCAEYLRGKQ